jgi:pyruvate dehydrogenase E2 component (dihydrolipoamide acetyltransferase)
MSTECTVPELGENVESATVVEVLVKAGDAIHREQSVLSLETDKAAFEMPSNVEGTVDAILVKTGDEVKVGQVVLRVRDGSAKPAAPSESATPSARAKPAGKTDKIAAAPISSRAAPKNTDPSRAKRDADSVVESASPSPSPKMPTATGVAASPSVRRLARERGIDLAKVSGTGPGGRVGADDLAAHASRVSGAAVGEGATAGLPDFTRFGPIEVEPMSKVRARTAEQMARAWSSIPHVTHHDAADVTDLDRLRGQYAKRVEKSGGKLTMTAVLLKVLGSALRKFPKFNSSVDMARHVIVYKKCVHVGVAVDTERGLLVPVIRDVDKMNIVEIALALREMSEKARNRNIRPDELQGAGFTITNLGGIGGRAFSPLINPPEVAVLGVSAARYEPFWTGAEFEPRQMLPLSVSYDHRVIDGADAARFLRWVCEALAEPFVMDLEGE